MSKFLYPIVAFFFNYFLLESFPSGGGGTGLGLLITIPIIIIISFLATGIHYFLEKRNKPTRYFKILSVFIIIIMSYFLFITEPDNTPFDIIKRMYKTEKEYKDITIDDFFIEDRYFNYEKIVAAKKKFVHQIQDTSFSVRVSNAYNYDSVFEIYGVMYKNGIPLITNKNVNVASAATDTFRFQENIGRDTFIYYGNEKFISKAINKSDTFITSGRPYPSNTEIKKVSTSTIFKDQTPDNKYFAYKIFYLTL